MVQPRWQAAELRRANGEKQCAYIDVEGCAAIVFGSWPKGDDLIVLAGCAAQTAFRIASDGRRPRSFLDMRGLDHLGANLVLVTRVILVADQLHVAE